MDCTNSDYVNTNGYITYALITNWIYISDLNQIYAVTVTINSKLCLF